MGATTNLFVPAAATIGGSYLKQSDSQSAETNLQELSAFAAGDFAPSMVGASAQEPEFSIATMDIATSIGLMNEASVARALASGEADMYFRQAKANAFREDEGSSKHIIARLENHIDSANPAGMLYWNSIEASQDAEAKINLRVAATGQLVVLADQAITAAPLYEEDYTLGEVVIHGTHLDGLQSVNWNNNVQVTKKRSSGEAFPSFVAARTFAPAITVEALDLKQQVTYVGSGNTGFPIVAGSGGVQVYFRRRKPDKMNHDDADTVHIKLSATAGTIFLRSMGGTETQGSLEIRLRRPSAGSDVFTVETGVAIPASS